jgi:hypothetical protein
VAPTIISAARVCLRLGERKPCRVQSKEQNRAERGRLESRIMGTNWHYKGADFAKSILRMEGPKCGSPPSWFEGDRFRPLIMQSNHGLKIGSYAPVDHQYESLKDNHQSRGSLTKHGLEQQTTLKCLRLNTQSASKLTWADHLDLRNSLLVSMDTTNVKRNDEGKRRKERTGD